MYTFIESSVFERVRPAYLDDDEYAELQQYRIQAPEAGQVIPGSGGVRKLRWSRSGMGKRGGLRVIYFVQHHRTSSGCSPSTPRPSTITCQRILKQLLEAFRDG